MTPAHGRRQLFCHGPPFFAVPITGKVRAADAARQLVIVQDKLIEDWPADLWPDRRLVPIRSRSLLRFRSRVLPASTRWVRAQSAVEYGVKI